VRFPIGLIAVMAALLVAGTACGSTTRGMPAPTTSADGDQALPHDGAPKVPNPVDVARFKAAPCTVLTESQLQTLGITAQPESRPDVLGGECRWQGGINGVNVQINFIPNPDGLSGLYKLHKQGRGQVFEPIAPINSFPAALDLPTDSRASGDCSYSVGFNDRDAAFIQIGERPGGNPCDDVKQVALSVTKTVKAGGS
jgi:Protein of unknown function (DUF3558)